MPNIDFKTDLNSALKCLKEGGVIVYPTDTVWGIGCDSASAEAVRRVFEIKRRADSKAMICLVGSVAQLERSVRDIPDVALELAELATSPVSIIYDHPIGLTPALLAEDGSAALRLTNERFSQQLCLGLRRPLVSTSANFSGCPTPGCFSEIDPELLRAVDYVVRYRREDRECRKSSAVIKIASDCQVKIIRK